VAVLLFAAAPIRADDKDLPPADKLVKAIQLYEKAQYDEASQLLRDIDDDKLNDDQQLRLQRYQSLARQALARIAEAKDDFEKAGTALQAKDLEKAKGLLEKVVSNPFAPAEVKSKAQTQLEEVNAKLAAPPPSAPPSAQQPAPAAQPAARPAPTREGASLLDQLSEEHELLWQQAVKTYRETEAKIRKAVLKEEFDQAHQQLDLAKRTLELNRRYASPASLYDDFRNQALELERYVEDEERQWQERTVREKYEEIARRENERIERISATKRRQVDGLMDQAGELRKERRFEDAIQVLEQVLAIDPENDRAAWMKETLEDLAMNIRDRQAGRDRGTEMQSLITENDEAGIPWHENLIYPKNWPEISAKRGVPEEGRETDENRAAKQKLRKLMPPEVKFDAVELQEAVSRLRTLTGLNIVPNWAALEAAGIEKDAEVALAPLPNVKYEKVLENILKQIGGSEVQLAYEIDDEGIVHISTKEDLGGNAFARVYNVQDLLIRVPDFASQLDLNQIGQQSGGGAAGGQYRAGQLQQQGGQQNPFRQGQQQGAEFGQTRGGTEEDPVEALMTLIRELVDRESWVEAGGAVGQIERLGNQIIVTQTSAAHNEIRDLLRELRQARTLQVAVEVRYITISRNWLEQIGLDLDVVLNNGTAGFDRTSIVDPATGNAVLMPRQFTRNGFTPLAPSGVGYTLPAQTLAQHPYGQVGFTPAAGDLGPHMGSMTPIPIVNNTMNLAQPQATNVDGSLAGVANQSPAFQIFGSFLDNIQVDFLLRASQIDRRASDLDAPRVVAFDGSIAVFESYLEQQYIAGLTPIIGENAGAFQPVPDTLRTGRSLRVRPYVSADRRYVTLTVNTWTSNAQNIRQVFFGGSQTVGSGFLELTSRLTQFIGTTVSVPDGGTLMMGGLKLSGEREIDAGVPILSRIPILKRAFSNTSSVKDDRVLLILIKPTIIIHEEAEAQAFPTLPAAK
jgi:general secretion pathway protein D